MCVGPWNDQIRWVLSLCSEPEWNPPFWLSYLYGKSYQYYIGIVFEPISKVHFSSHLLDTEWHPPKVIIRTRTSAFVNVILLAGSRVMAPAFFYFCRSRSMCLSTTQHPVKLDWPLSWRRRSRSALPSVLVSSSTSQRACTTQGGMALRRRSESK